MKEKTLVKILLPVLLCISSAQLFSASVDEVQNKVREATQNSATTQQRINDIDALNKAQDRQYLALLSDLDTVKKSNQHLEKQISLQNQELASLNKQLLSVVQVDREIEPLMLKMVDSLQAFVAADLPFLLNVREAALAELKKDLSSARLTLSEKYQRLMQAYVAESEYSVAIHSYQGELLVDKIEKQVVYYRLGRVAYYYQGLDKKEGARWSALLKEWVLLFEDENEALSKAIEVANELKIPQLIALPFAQVSLGAKQ
jgi:hypothetical protein